MRAITVQSRKYDGTLRDEYAGWLYAEDAETWTVYVPPGTRGYDHRRREAFEAPDGLIELYFKARWYAVWHICEQHSARNQMYIHLAMPATASPDGIAWVDLDLDYRAHLDGSLERLDEDEYQVNRARMGYPPALHAQVQAACAAIETGYARQSAAFDHAAYVALYEQMSTRARRVSGG